jgi:tetratricopeptide (TPR) repeat protein/uncharacterized RDD family membrane protein YckC
MRKLILVLACAIIAGSTIANADEKLVDLVKKVKPGVVLIETFDKDNKPIGQGSGFFIDNKSSLITNHHVIEGAYSATIKTSSGKEYPVQGIIAKDTEADIVKLVVNLPDANMTFLNLSENVPSEGEDIFVIGNPLGLESTVSSGIVSAVRDIPAFGKILQITAPISPGSSGSPVINTKGQVIGIATLIVTKGQNLNFAIPSDKIIALKETSKTTLSESYASLTTDANDAQLLFEKGVKESWQGNWSAALTYFKKVTAENPQDANAWFYNGYCYGKLGRQQEEIEAYKQTVRIKPDYAEAHYNLGVAYGKLGRYEEAIEAYKQAIRIKPDDADAHVNLGVTYYNLDRYQEAIEAFKQAIRINPDDAGAHGGLGIAYDNLGRYQDAIESYKQAIRIKPDDAGTHGCLGVTYDKLGRYEEAIEAYKQAIRIKPDYANVHYALGIAYLASTGDKGSALEEYKILKTLDAEMANKLFNLISSSDTNEIGDKPLSENASSSGLKEPLLYHNTEGHFSLTIPAGWEEIPKDAIETAIKSLQESYGYTSPPQYGGGFQKLDTTYFSRPYVLFGIDRSGRWSESQIEKLLSSNELERTVEEAESELSKQLPGLVQKSKPGQTIFDKAKNMLFIKSEDSISVFFLSNYGSVDLHCYSTKENFENDLPYFTHIVDSFRYDIGYEYNQFTKNKSSNTASGSLFGVGLIVFICVGLVILVVIIVRRKSSGRSNSFPETLQASVQPSASAPSIQILEEENKVTKRSIFLRALFGFLWFILIRLLSNMIIGGIVGAFAGTSTKSFEEGYNAGRSASIDFFQKYGLLIFLAQVILTVILSVIEFLPGTSQYKKIKIIKSTSISSLGEEPTQMVLASSWQRFGTMLLDIIFYCIFSFILVIVLYLIGLGDLIQNMNNNILGYVLLFIYYVSQETYSGRTLGKLITGTKAVSEDGSNLTFGQAIGRTLCRFIPFEAFSFLGGRGMPRGWHDKIPKTKVISLRRPQKGAAPDGDVL